MKIILAIIIVVFIFYFGAMRGRQQTETIAVIDGVRLTYAEYSKEYQDLMDSYRQRYGANLTNDILKKLNLQKAAFDNLINRVILLRKADELNLDVSDEEFKTAIFSFPAFQIDGTFNKTLFERILRQNRLTPEEFEVSQKRMLKIGKLERLIKESVKVTEKEVYDIYRIQYGKINANYITISVNDFRSGIKPLEKDLDKYLKEHQEDFRIPQKVSVKYIAFPGTDFAGSEEMSEESIEEYYNYHQDDFKKNDKGDIRPLSEVRDEIVSELRLIEGMGIAGDEAQKAHDIIYQEENLEEYAKAHAIEVKTTEFFSAENPPTEIANVKDLITEIFNLKETEITPVLSDATTHYIFGEVSVKPSRIAGLSDVRDEIREIYIETEARKLCEEKARDILTRLKKGENINTLVKKEGLKLSETGMIPAGSGIRDIGYSPALSEALYEISEKKPYPDGVYYVDGNYVILGFKERGALDEKDWEKKKDALKTFLLRLKEQKYFSSWLEETRESMTSAGKIKIRKDVAAL
jgi:peptidyl-prolyl cis-trans isomerase D